MNESEIYVHGGKYGIVIAADTKSVSSSGHITNFPGSENTVIAQFPLSGNALPAHMVLHSGGCLAQDLQGL